MSDPAGPLLSVRGEARRMVPSDCAVVAAGIGAGGDRRRRRCGPPPRNWTASPPDLAAQGGVALNAGSGRAR